MLVTRNIGRLIEPLTGRAWDAGEIFRNYQARVVYFARRGLTRHDRVFLHNGNTLEFFIDLLATWHLGACAVPIDSRLTAFELSTLAQSATPKLSVWTVLVSTDAQKALASHGVIVVQSAQCVVEPTDTDGPPPSAAVLDDDALILFTSGTTGNPKGVVHTHRSLHARWASLAGSLGIETFRKTLCLLPTHFGHGLICNCLFPWLYGQDLYVLPPFRADILTNLGALIDSHEISFLSSVPTVWKLALKTSKPPVKKSLARVFCGSAPLNKTLWRSVQEWTGVEDVRNVYGITETASWLAGTTVPDPIPEDGLIGRAWGGDLAVLRSGETSTSPIWAEPCKPNEAGYVWINTPALMKGYLDRDDLTSEVVSQGWFSSGDTGVIDERGYLYLLGREREEINKAGQKIYPGDVDSVIERFEETMDVCTFGFLEPLQGEDVGIAVILRKCSDDILIRLHQWASEHLGAHQVPKRWYVVQDIPRSSRGKINRRAVAQMCDQLTPAPLARLLRGQVTK
jgi:oxalate---CoA ligase